MHFEGRANRIFQGIEHENKKTIGSFGIMELHFLEEKRGGVDLGGWGENCGVWIKSQY